MEKKELNTKALLIFIIVSLMVNSITYDLYQSNYLSRTTWIITNIIILLPAAYFISKKFKC